jgi:probable phosphoglycerate mutase
VIEVTKDQLPPLAPRFCRFYVIRHGETLWNTQRRMQGHADSPLTEKGLTQAQDRAKELAQVPFTEIFSSDLLRAQRTAEIIALEHNLAVTSNQLLRERAFGAYEGKTVEEYQELLKDMLQQLETLGEKEQFTFKVSQDIESDEEVMMRMITFLRQTAIAYPQKTIGVVCHGGIMRALLVHLGFASHKALAHGAIKNLSYVVIDSDGTDFFVHYSDGIELRPD